MISRLTVGCQDIQFVGKASMSSLTDSEADQVDRFLITNGLEPLNKPTGPVCVILLGFSGSKEKVRK